MQAFVVLSEEVRLRADCMARRQCGLFGGCMTSARDRLKLMIPVSTLAPQPILRSAVRRQTPLQPVTTSPSDLSAVVLQNLQGEPADTVPPPPISMPTSMASRTAAPSLRRAGLADVPSRHDSQLITIRADGDELFVSALQFRRRECLLLNPRRGSGTTGEWSVRSRMCLAPVGDDLVDLL